MSKRRDADVVIIGGGITGCAAAYHLAMRGKRVTIVEKGETAGEASGRNTGGVRVQGRNPVEYPFMLDCIKMWEGLEKELGADMGYVTGGNLLYVENEADMKEIERGARLAKEHGVDSYAISPEECRELVPGLNAPVLGALYSPTDGHADPARSTKAFEMAARELGVEVLTNCAALDIDTSDGQVTSVRTDMGRIDAPYIVNAAGVWANHVGRKVGQRFPVRIIRQTQAITEPVSRRIMPFVRGPNSGFRQEPGGGFLFTRGYNHPRDYDVTRDTFDNIRMWLPQIIRHHKLVRFHVGRALFRSFHARTPLVSRVGRPWPLRSDVEPRVNRETVDEGLRQLGETVPWLKGVREERAWAGLIDLTPDMLPVFGAVDKPKGYIVAAGFSGHGFAMGPMSGKLISELIVDGKTSIDIDAFRPSRFAEGVPISPPRNFVG